MTNDQVLTVRDYSSQITEDNKNVIQNDTPLMQKFELTKISPIEEMISKENEEVLNEDNISVKDSLPKMSYYPENNGIDYNDKNFNLKSDNQHFATIALPQRLLYNSRYGYDMQHVRTMANKSVTSHKPSRTCSGGSFENKEWLSEYNDENSYENFFTKGKKILIKGNYKRYNNINTQNIKKIFPENKNFQRKKKFERKKVNRKKSQF